MRFKEMCRTCMCVGHELYPLFPQKNSTVKGLPHVSEMVMAISSCRLKPNDGLPGQVCMQCIKSVELTIHFRDLSEKSESLYRKYLSERNILTLTPPDESMLDTALVKQESCAESFDADDDYTDDFLIYKTEMEVPVEGPKEEKPPLTDVKRKLKVRSCDSCNKTYLTRKALRRHALIHKASRFSCMKHCKSVFSRRDHLKKHLQTVHSVEDVDTFMNVLAAKPKVKYDCEHCGVDAPSKVAMAKHLRACHRDKLPPRKNGNCDVESSDKDSEDDNCYNNEVKDSEEVTKVDTRRTVGEVSASGGGAIATIKEERGEDGDPSGLVLEVRYECAQCGAAYDSQHSYAAHMTKHSQPVPKGQTTFRCNVCDKVFHKRKNLKQHSLTHNKEKANKCTLCCRAFTRPDQLILHMNNHTGKKRHQCTHCEKGFNMLSTLKDHLRTHSGEKPFLCSICGKGFTQNTNLKQHLMRHSATKPFTCPTCLNKFVSKGELDAHLRKHTGEHPFVCSTCGTGFTTSSSLVKHKRIHSGERPYLCDLCPQRFTALGTLKNHRRTHTGEKPFACTHCIRAFAQKSDLVSHIRTHTGERPYVCSICGSPYQQSSALKAHIKAHHSTNAKVPLNVVMDSQLTDIQSAYRTAIDNSQSPHFSNP